MRKWIPYITAFIVGIAAYALFDTARYADVGTFQKRDIVDIAPFDDFAVFDQTFIPAKSNLAAIEFPIISTGYPEGYQFYVSVQLTDDRGNEIANEQYSISRSPKIDTVLFSFRPQSDSLHKTYHLVLHTDAPPHVLSLAGSEYDTYPAGTLTSGTGSPASQDLSFFTYSRPGIPSLLGEMIEKSGSRLFGILLITIVFCGMGFIFTGLFLPHENLIELAIHTLLAGIALPPLGFFVLALFGIKFSNAVLPIVLAGLLLIVGIGVRRWLLRKQNKAATYDPLPWKESLVLCLLLILATMTRMIQIDDLIVPSGIGSQFHDNAVEQIRQAGALPLDSIYHLGFHSNAFLVSQLTRTSSPEAILVYGQLLSIVSGLSLYLLARIFFKNWIYAVTAVALFWFVSPIPAYLINIGRYPFLQGLTLLLWAGTLIWKDLKEGRSNVVVLSVAWIGLLLTHYGLFAIFGILMAGFLVIERLNQNCAGFKQWTSFAAVGGAVLLIALIKLYYVLTHGSWNSFLESQTIAFTLQDYLYFAVHTLRHGGLILWILGIIGGIHYFRRNTNHLQVAIFCLSALAAVDWLQLVLFGHSATRPTNTLFVLAIPLSILAAYLLEQTFQNRERLALASVGILTLAGAYNISGVVNPRNVFFSSADQRAMEWIQANVPQQSIILINSYPWDEKYGPADGGYWIQNMTGRQTVYANSDEESSEMEDFISQTAADFVYFGPGYGNITPALMRRFEGELVYNKDGVFIYSIDANADD